MSTINVFATKDNDIIFAVGELKEDAPIIGVRLKPGVDRDEGIAEMRGNIDRLGGLLFMLKGGTCDYAKLSAENPVKVGSWEADNVDLSDFEASEADEDEAAS